MLHRTMGAFGPMTIGLRGGVLYIIVIVCEQQLVSMFERHVYAAKGVRRRWSNGGTGQSSAPNSMQ
jgi:hypothetical protein